jgi:hypothetical protein
MALVHHAITNKLIIQVTGNRHLIAAVYLDIHRKIVAARSIIECKWVVRVDCITALSEKLGACPSGHERLDAILKLGKQSIVCTYVIHRHARKDTL